MLANELGELRQEPMMAHLLDSLEAGKNIGNYGRLVFVMVARHFMNDDELFHCLIKDPGCDENGARALLKQVEARGYNPPKREKVLEWMQKQNFPICPDPEDSGQCNVYRNLEFPKEIYDRISEFYEGNTA
jgi:hypothetical protein